MRDRFCFWGTAVIEGLKWLWYAMDHGGRLVTLLALIAAAGLLFFSPHLPFYDNEDFQPPRWAWWAVLLFLGVLALGEGVYAASQSRVTRAETESDRQHETIRLIARIDGMSLTASTTATELGPNFTIQTTPTPLLDHGEEGAE